MLFIVNLAQFSKREPGAFSFEYVVVDWDTSEIKFWDVLNESHCLKLILLHNFPKFPKKLIFSSFTAGRLLVNIFLFLYISIWK